MGDILHYRVPPFGVLQAALVTEVYTPDNPETALSLAVFEPGNLKFLRGVQYGPGQNDRWAWREEPHGH